MASEASPQNTTVGCVTQRVAVAKGEPTHRRPLSSTKHTALGAHSHAHDARDRSARRATTHTDRATLICALSCAHACEQAMRFFLLPIVAALASSQSAAQEPARRELSGFSCQETMKMNAESLKEKIDQWSAEAERENIKDITDVVAGLISAAVGVNNPFTAALIDLATDVEAAILGKAHDNLGNVGTEILNLQSAVAVCITEVANQLSITNIMDRVNDALTAEANLKRYLTHALENRNGDWHDRKANLQYAIGSSGGTSQIGNIYSVAEAQWFATGDGNGMSGRMRSTLDKPSETDVIVWRTAVQQAYKTLATVHRNAITIATSLYTLLKADAVRNGVNIDVTEIAGAVSTVDQIAFPLRAHKTEDGDYVDCNGKIEQGLCILEQKDKIVAWINAANDNVITQAMLEYKSALEARNPDTQMRLISAKEANFANCGERYKCGGAGTPACDTCHRPHAGSYHIGVPDSISFHWKGQRNYWFEGQSPWISSETMKKEASLDLTDQYERTFAFSYAATCSTMQCSDFLENGKVRESKREAFCSGKDCDDDDVDLCCTNTCFPGSTLLQSRAGPKRADQITVGDKVLVATEQSSLVWDTIAMAVSHNQPSRNRTFDYRHIETSTGHTLKLSPDHYIHARKPASNVSCCGAATLMAAADLAVGDQLWTAGTSGSTSLSTVTSISLIVEKSAYNFLLLQDPEGGFQTGAPREFHSLVTDGIVASSFTTHWRLLTSHGPHAADRLGDPARALYRAGLRLEGTEVDGDAGILNHQGVSTQAARPGTIFSASVKLQNIIADCVEAQMVGCSEAELEAKVQAVFAALKEGLPPSVVANIMLAVDAAADASLGVVGRAARRLSSFVSETWIRNHTAHVTHEVTVIVRSQAGAICCDDLSCAANAPSDASLAITAVIIGSLALALVVLLLAVIFFIFLRHCRASPTPSGTTTAQVSTVAKASPAVPAATVESV